MAALHFMQENGTISGMTLSNQARLEALLFAASEPLSKKRLSAVLEISIEEVEGAAGALREQLEDTTAPRGLALIEAGDELELRTSSAAAALIQKYRESELSRDLGKAGLEALAVILYKGGATRSEIDWVRGVNSAAALRSLQLRGLVHRGEDVTDRRRIRYTATIEALAHLGVSRVEDLPGYKDLTSTLTEQEVQDGEAAQVLATEPTPLTEDVL